ncbi:acetyl-coenzyme A carboxylase carboxyl transferase subunit alpha, chloroplastic-like protein [Tanacetum coccineum]
MVVMIIRQWVKVGPHLGSAMHLELVFAAMAESSPHNPVMVTGIKSIDGKSDMFIRQQKGRNTKKNVTHNFAMPTPHGTKKCKPLGVGRMAANTFILVTLELGGKDPFIMCEVVDMPHSVAYSWSLISVRRSSVGNTDKNMRWNSVGRFSVGSLSVNYLLEIRRKKSVINPSVSCGR